MESYKEKMDQYIKKYCVKHKVTKEEALQHSIVREVAKLYQDKTVNRSDFFAGCGCIDTEDKSC